MHSKQDALEMAKYCFFSSLPHLPLPSAILLAIDIAALSMLFPIVNRNLIGKASYKSMVLLITSRGHHPDGTYFSFDGLTPNRFVNESDQKDLIHFAATYLAYVNMQRK